MKRQSSIIQQAVTDASNKNDFLLVAVMLPILVKHLDNRWNTIMEFIKKKNGMLLCAGKRKSSNLADCSVHEMVTD